jgi:putative intracellular protease/amidase
MIFNNRAFLALVVLTSSTVHAFVAPKDALRPRWVLKASGSDVDVNGATGSSLVAAGNQDNKSRLASAFAALDETDQYDAVLTGLCAKILDDTADEEAKAALQDPIKLMQEMNARRVTASGRSLMALIDVSS